MYTIITQIVSLLAMAVSVASFQLNKHKTIIIMQIITSTLFGIQYYMLGAYTGAVLNIVAVIRNIVFYCRDKRWARGNVWTVIFSVAMAAVGFISWQGWQSLLMIVAMILNTVSFSCPSPKNVRRIILTSSPFMLAYSIVTGSLGGILNEIFVEISTVTAMIRLDLPRKSGESE